MSPCRNWDSPTPSLASGVCPSPGNQRGGGGTLAYGWGVGGVPIPTTEVGVLNRNIAGLARLVSCDTNSANLAQPCLKLRLLEKSCGWAIMTPLFDVPACQATLAGGIDSFESITEPEFLNNPMGARNRVGKGLSYRSARLQRLAELIPWNQFLSSLKISKFELWAP